MGLLVKLVLQRVAPVLGRRLGAGEVGFCLREEMVWFGFMG